MMRGATMIAPITEPPRLAPLLLAFPAHRLARRVLRLEPHLRRSAAIGRIRALRPDVLQTHPADGLNTVAPSLARCSLNRIERRMPRAVFWTGFPQTFYGIQPKNVRVQQSQDWLRFRRRSRTDHRRTSALAVLRITSTFAGIGTAVDRGSCKRRLAGPVRRWQALDTALQFSLGLEGQPTPIARRAPPVALTYLRVMESNVDRTYLIMRICGRDQFSGNFLRAGARMLLPFRPTCCRLPVAGHPGMSRWLSCLIMNSSAWRPASPSLMCARRNHRVASALSHPNWPPVRLSAILAAL